MIRGPEEERGTGGREKGIKCHLSQAISNDDTNSVLESSIQHRTEYGGTTV